MLRPCFRRVGRRPLWDLSKTFFSSETSNAVRWNQQASLYLKQSTDQSNPSPVEAQMLMDQLLLLTQREKVNDVVDEEDHDILESEPDQENELDLLDADLAFAFLDGYVQLQGERPSDDVTITDNDVTWLHRQNLLNTVLHKWRQTLPSDAGCIAPSEMLVKLDNYRTTPSANALGLLPDVQSYNIVLDGAATMKQVDMGVQLYHWMWAESVVDDLVKPDIVTLRTLFKAWVLSNRPDAAEQCEQLVDDYLQRTSTSSNNTAKSMTSAIYKSLIHVWALEYPEQAEAYLQDMVARYWEDPQVNEAPDTIAWNRLLSSYSIHHQQPSQAARLLQDFWEFSKAIDGSRDEAGRRVGHPDLFSYNAVLEGWARIGNAKEANKVFHLLRSAASIHPNIISYTSAMKANRGDPAMVEELANDCLEVYKEQLRSSPVEDCTPSLTLDQGFFHTWLRAVVREPAHVEQAQTILFQTMPHYGFRPDSKCFGLLLQAFLEKDDLEGATKWLLQNLTEMEEMTIVTWAHQLLDRGEIQVMSFLDKLFALGGSKRRTNQSLLQMLVQKGHLQETESLERLISKLTAEQGLNVLQWMDQSKRTQQCFAWVMRALAQESNGPGAEELLQVWQEQKRLHPQLQNSDLDSQMHTSVVVAWSKAGNQERVMELFDAWLQDSRLPPPSRTAQTAVLSCMAQAFQPNQAEAFLQRLEGLYEIQEIQSKPDVIMYNIVLKAWVLAANGKRARQFLEAAMDSGHGVVPDVVSFNSVVQAHVKQRQLDRALTFVEEVMVEQGRQDPDLATFRSILTGWSKSRQEDAAQKADEIWRYMEELHQQGILRNAPDDHCRRLVAQCHERQSRQRRTGNNGKKRQRKDSRKR